MKLSPPTLRFGTEEVQLLHKALSKKSLLLFQNLRRIRLLKTILGILLLPSVAINAAAR